MKRHLTKTLVPLALVLTALLAGCAAGDARYAAETPAGFFAGLWHGMISVIALVVGIFSDSVEVYERFNTGGWYDFAFLLGVMLIWGGGAKARKKRWRQREEPWEDAGRSIKAEIEKELHAWAEAEPDEDWEEVGRRLKRKLREWLEEPDEES